MRQFIILLFSVFVAQSCNNDKKPASVPKDENHAAHNTNGETRNYVDSVNHGLIEKDTLKGSPHLTAMNTINGVHVHIEYSSPGVKDRVIWGGLVGYDKVWVTGAHKATTVQFNKDVEIDGKKIPKGIYALFTIPGKDKWKVMLNTRYNQHLADEYNENEDQVRLSIKPVENGMTQRLTYLVSKTDTQSGSIVMQWEKLKIEIPFKTIQE